MAMTIESTSLRAGELVPDAYCFGVLTADGPAPAGGNRSPHLGWSGAPDGTRSFAVLVVDPDVPADASNAGVPGTVIEADADRVDFAHWVLVDLPPSVTELPEGTGGEGITLKGKPLGPSRAGGVQGVNNYTTFFAGNPDMGGTYGGYDGPFPPPNDERLHHYHFTVFALDVDSLGLSGEFDLAAARQAMEGHILDSAEIVTVYSLNETVRRTL